ncbi:MAG: RNA polymerase sporulation sigma factor SigE [Lachnospirales bacterium]
MWLCAQKLVLTKEASEKTILYIGGSDILPEPLGAQEEAKALQMFTQEGEEKEKGRQLLIEHNLRLVVYIAKKFENTGMNVEDLISIGTIGLIKAINTFKPDKKIKLATYASRCIENEILMVLRRNSRMRGEISIDEPLNVDWDGNELLLSDILSSEQDTVSKGIEEQIDRDLLRRSLEILTPRERSIIDLRFGLNTGGKEMTQKEVADRMGISQSYISRLEKRIMKRLQKEMVRLM